MTLHKQLPILFFIAAIINPLAIVNAQGVVGKSSLPVWNNAEIATLRQLWIGTLPAPPPDPTNAVSINNKAIKFGHKLFFDTRFSRNGKIACATCHQPHRYFSDGLARAVGLNETPRGTPSLIGVSFSPWLFWDGRADSLWSQAIEPLENEKEHGGNRTQYAHIIYHDTHLRAAYTDLFDAMPNLFDTTRFPLQAGPVPDKQARKAWERMSPQDQKSVTEVFVNIAKAIAAYERMLQPGPGRFDKYVSALINKKDNTNPPILSENEIAGLHLFIGKAKCTMCHNGPLFTNFGFHNIGTPRATGKRADNGRYIGIHKARNSEFNCFSEHNDAQIKKCDELQFAKTLKEDTEGAFKVPSLRNVAETAPYMHAGQYKTLIEVVRHYNKRPLRSLGHTELLAIDLNETEIKQIVAFLHTLTGEPNTNTELLIPLSAGD